MKATVDTGNIITVRDAFPIHEEDSVFMLPSIASKLIEEIVL